MRPCPRCGRMFAEVLGAEEQACPHCGLVFATRDAPAPQAAGRVDPVAALALAGRTLPRRYLPLLLLWSPAVVANVLVSLLVADAIPGDPSRLPFSEQMRALGIVTPALAALGALELALWAVLAAAAFGSARDVLRRPGALVGLGVLLTLTYFAGVLLLVIPFFVFFHWFLHAPAALADGRTVGQAFEASRAFAKERRTYGFTLIVLLAWALVAGAAHLVSLPLTAALAAGGLPPHVAEALATSLAAWPFAPLVPLLPASYWRLASGKPAPPVAEATSAPAARSSTTCPRCGALVPYVPTGAPVEVVCPSCGAKGRVL